MIKTHYELKPGANSVQIGSIVVGEHGYATSDPTEKALLDSYPDVRAAEPAKPTKEETR